jgi:hypothetical protein
MRAGRLAVRMPRLQRGDRRFESVPAHQRSDPSFVPTPGRGCQEDNLVILFAALYLPWPVIWKRFLPEASSPGNKSS